MTCEEYRKLLSEYETENASDTILEMMNEHEETCLDCKKMRSASDTVHSYLEKMKNTDVPEMPESAHTKWMNAIRETKQPGKQKRKRGLRNGLAIAAAAVICLGIGGIWSSRNINANRNQMTGNSKVRTSSLYNSAYDDDYESAYEAEEAMFESNMAYSAAIDSGLGTADLSNDMSELTNLSDKKIIRTASMTLATTEFEECVESIRTLCISNGGWIGQSSIDSASSGLKRASLSLRIPAEKLDEFLRGTASLARVVSQNETAEDVTESYHDRETRLHTQELLLERLQSLVGTTSKLSDLLSLEEQIAETQYKIDSLKGSLQSTDRYVQYSTVDISVREEKSQDVVETKTLSFGERVAAAFSLGLSSFVEGVQSFCLWVASNIPGILIFVVLLVIFRKLVWPRISVWNTKRRLGKGKF